MTGVYHVALAAVGQKAAWLPTAAAPQAPVPAPVCTHATHETGCKLSTWKQDRQTGALLPFDMLGLLTSAMMPAFGLEGASRHSTRRAPGGIGSTVSSQAP